MKPNNELMILASLELIREKLGISSKDLIIRFDKLEFENAKYDLDVAKLEMEKFDD